VRRELSLKMQENNDLQKKIEVFVFVIAKNIMFLSLKKSI